METNKPHFSEVNPIDFPESDEYKTFEEKILQAIGNIIDDNEIRKKYFAVAIYEGLEKAVIVGKDLENLNDRLKSLAKYGRKARKASQDFYSKLTEIHAESEAFVGDPFDNILNEMDKADQAVKVYDQFLREIDIIKKEFTQPHKKLIKSGKNNTHGLIPATFIASVYYKFFQKEPGTSHEIKSPYKEGVIILCPFDRVCEVVSEAFSINISSHTIRKSKKLYSIWYNIERLAKKN